MGGQVMNIYYDKKCDKLNLELVKKKFRIPSNEHYYEIHFQDWSKDNKSKTLLKLHIKEAIELKSIIDNLVYAALSGEEDD